MIINEKLLALISESQLEANEALIFCFCVEYLGDSSVEWLIEKGLITEDNEHLFRINLMNKDYEENSYVLREPLFAVVQQGSYYAFVEQLNNDYHFTSKGHPNNQMDYTVMSDNEETRMAYDRLLAQIGSSFDMGRLVRATVSYYEKTSRCRALGKYLAENALIDYRSVHEQDQSKLI